jgi:hypothetical protein
VCNICCAVTALVDLARSKACAGGVRPRCKPCHAWERKKRALGLALPPARPPTGKRVEIEAYWAERRRREDSEVINVTITEESEHV